jgi:hypothetical protein
MTEPKTQHEGSDGSPNGPSTLPLPVDPAGSSSAGAGGKTPEAQPSAPIVTPKHWKVSSIREAAPPKLERRAEDPD